MKVVISGGIRTENIVNGINKKFNSGGVDFIVVPFIEDIEYIYQRGEYFDKAIIIEQCWNHDFEDDDEVAIRNRINNFANASSNRGLTNVSYVFLTQDADTASKVYEEILSIQQSSVIIIKEPRYSVSFFNTLVTTEIDKFPAEMVYKPIIKEEIQAEKVEEDESSKLHSPEYDVTYEEDDISKALFGEDEGEFDANRLAKKEEADFDFTKHSDEDIDETEDINFNDLDFDDSAFDIPEGENDIAVDTDETFESGDIDNSAFDNTFSDDSFGEFSEQNSEFDTQENIDNNWENQEGQQTFSTDYDEEFDNSFQKSGEIPDFSGDDTFEPQGEQLNNAQSGIDFNKTDENAELGMYDDGYYDETPVTQEEYNPDLDNFNVNQPLSGQFNDEDYDSEPDVVATNQRQYQRIDMSNDQIKATLDAFANRGNSILLTGCGGCGTSTIALNLANIINNLGYTVLLVDLDTENKAQSYISKDNYECVEPDSAGLMAAINSTSGINAHISIVRQGFHLLTMGMSSDSSQIDKIIHKDKISRFINLAKTSHNFVIYDAPFKTAIGFGKDFTFMADNVVVTVDCSNWGITKTMLNMCNIEDDDMQETLFNRGQLLFNRYRVINKVMGRKVKTAMDITKVMDFKVRELIGEDPGFYFQSMHISGLVNEDNNFEAGWFESTQYSDTDIGSKLFLELVKNIVLKR